MGARAGPEGDGGLPGLVCTAPTDVFAGELDLGAARILDCGTGHSASDSVVWVAAERILFAADLLGVDSHLNLAHGDPRNWLANLDRLQVLAPERVVPGHGPPAGPETIPVARDYIETLLDLAARPGDHAMPDACAGWAFPEGFQQNIAALRGADG